MFKKSLLFMMLLTLFGVARAQSELTVYEGTATSNVVPAYIFYYDDFTRVQHVIPADDLGEMRGGTITSLKYYTSATNIPYTAVSKAQVYLMEVDYTTMTALEPQENGEIVYEGYFELVSEGEGGSLTIEFNTPFNYSGGNLLIGIDNTEDLGYKNISFYGQSITGAAWGGSSGTSLASVTGSQRNFIPQTTFTYTPGSGPVCDRPSTLTVRDGSVTAHAAIIEWEGGSGNYNFEYKKSTEEEYHVFPTSSTIFSLEELTQNTTYNVRVQSVCAGGATSGYKTTSFTTLLACPAPTGLSVALVPGDGTKATFSWTETGSATEWQLCLDGNEDDLITMTTNPFTYNRFTPEQTYSAKVRAYCDAVDQSSWSNTVTFTPTDAYLLTVNDGTNTNAAVPVYGYWADQFSKSQFIIPADDLAAMAFGTINKLTFYSSNASVAWGVAEFEVYVKEVSYTTFEAVEDWTTMELVKSAGALSVNGNIMEVTLDNPYQYLGDNLMIGILQTTKGTYSSVTWYGVTTEENTAIGGYENSKSLGFVKFLPKTTFDFTPGEAPSCLKPTGLTVNYTEGNTAVVSWNSTATAWNMKLNGTAVSGTITNPYTLTNLALGTEYSVEVQAKCSGSDVSEWAGPVTFTTDACMPEDKIIVNYELADSYGDGWNNNYILVIDENCDIVEALTIASGSSATGTIGICGSYAQFAWYMGSYPGETSWVFTDKDGNELFAGAGSASMATGDILYTIDNNTYPAPTDIDVAEVGPHSAKLSWTENGTATAWQIMLDEDEDNIIEANSNPFVLTGLDPETDYFAQVRAKGTSGTSMWTCIGISFTTTEACPAPYDFTATGITYQSAHLSWTGFGESYDLRYMALGSKGEVNDKSDRDSWYYYDNGTVDSGIGTGSETDVYWGIMLPAGMTNNTTLTKVSFYSSSDYDETITLSVYTGGTDAPGTLLYTEDIEPEAADAFQEVTLATPVSYDCLANLWIVLKQYGEYPAMGCEGLTDPNGRWISLDGVEWNDVNEYGLNYTWLLRAYCEGEVVLPWTNVTGINASEYDLTGLEAETQYTVQVRSNCGDDGTSDWSSLSFTTGGMCDAPTELTVDASYNIATISWTSGLDEFNVRYRGAQQSDPSTPATIILEAHDVWEDESGYQMLFDATATAYGRLWTSTHYIMLVDGTQYSGGDIPSDYYDEFAYAIPEGADGALSTTNVVVDDIVTITIPAGTYDYVILNPTPGDKFYIAADNGEIPCAGDDFVFEPGVTYHFTMGKFGSGDGAAFEAIHPMSDWTTTTVYDTSIGLGGLTPNTYYEWQVQGVSSRCDGGTTEWTEVQNFTTEPLPIQTIALAEGWNYISIDVDVTWAQFQAAIVEALPNTAITVKQKDKTSTYNPSTHRWQGSMTWNIATNSYRVKATTNGELNLQGWPIDPAEHPITVKNGKNWIAYPLDVPMSLTNAFAGFAVNGDVIKSKDGSATYTRGRWMGTTLTTLEPGQGYVYTSSQTNDRTLTYPIPVAKSAAPKAIETPKVNEISGAVKSVKQDPVFKCNKDIKNINLKQLR